jgi:UDP-N-acetyl-2-amino-2-deoxyglucuronate dehydrogenase
LEKKTGFGILGCGVIGPGHAIALSRIEQARVVAVCDLVEARAKALAEQYGCRYYLDYSEMLRDRDVEVVNVCTPSGSHAELAVMAAREGKHVIVEKPLDISLAKIDMVIDECRRRGVMLAPIFNSRFHASAQLVRRAIEEQKLGRLISADVYLKCSRSKEYYQASGWRGTWKYDGGGALMNQGIHSVDRILWYMGEAESVTARMANLVHDVEVEDTLCAVVKYRNGGMGIVQTTTAAYGGSEALQAVAKGNPYRDLYSRLEVGGTTGTILVEDEKIARFVLQDGGAPPTLPADDPARRPWGGHEVQIRDVLAAIAEGRQPLVTGQDARRAVQTILAMYESARTGREVRVDQISSVETDKPTSRRG